jgi:hypothetical protein
MAIAEREATPPPPLVPTPVEPSELFTITIRIYVYPQGGRWYAASTDYVLMAEGATEAEAVQQFVGSAQAYVASALAHGWIDALNSRPPFLRRFEIRRRVMVARLLRRHPLSVRRRLAFDWTSLRLA